MIALIASFLVRKGIQSKYAAPLAYLSAAIGIALLIASAWGLVKMLIHHHDNVVRKADRAAITNQVHAEVNAATVKADAAENEAVARDLERQVGLNGAVNNAVLAHPVEARKSTGPASQAALDRLRRK